MPQEKTDTSYSKDSLSSCLWQLLITNGSHGSNGSGLAPRWCSLPYPAPKTAHRATQSRVWFHRFFIPPFCSGNANNSRSNSSVRFTTLQMGRMVISKGSFPTSHCLPPRFSFLFSMVQQYNQFPFKTVLHQQVAHCYCDHQYHSNHSDSRRIFVCIICLGQ